MEDQIFEMKLKNGLTFYGSLETLAERGYNEQEDVIEKEFLFTKMDEETHFEERYRNSFKHGIL